MIGAAMIADAIASERKRCADIVRARISTMSEWDTNGFELDHLHEILKAIEEPSGASTANPKLP